MAERRCQTCGAKSSSKERVPTTSGEIECCRYCADTIRSRARDTGDHDYIFEFDLRRFKRAGMSLHVYFNTSRGGGVGSDEALMKDYIAAAINRNATRIGMVHMEEPCERAPRQLAALRRALHVHEDSRLLRIMEDMPPTTAAELETIIILIEGEHDQSQSAAGDTD